MNGLPQFNPSLRGPVPGDIAQRGKWRADIEQKTILESPSTTFLSAISATNLLSGSPLSYTSGTTRIPFAVNRLSIALSAQTDRRTLRVWLEVNREGSWTAIATLRSGAYVRAELRSAEEVRVRATGDSDDVLYSYSITGRYLRDR